MTFVGVSPCIICLLYLATLGLALGQTCVPSENPSCTQDESDIGDPYATGQGNRKLLQASKATALPPQSLVPVLTNRRSLLEAMCSETDNSPDAVRTTLYSALPLMQDAFVQVIQCTNAVRSSPRSFSFPCGMMNENGGLGPLSMNEELMEAAEKHSKDNAQMGDLTHKGSDGSWASTRVRRTGYSAGMVRENIAYGYLSARSVVFGWMCSSGHRKNIMSCDTAHIGVGLAQGYNGRYYHTQVFACPQGQQCTCSGGGGEDGGSGEEEEEKPVASPVEGGGYQPVPYQEYPYSPYYQIPYKKTDKKKPHGGVYYYDYPPYYGYGSGHGSGPSHSGEEEEKPTPSPQDPYMMYGEGQGGQGGPLGDPYTAAEYKDGPYIHVARDGHPIESHSGHYVTLSTMPGHGQYAAPGGHSGDD